MIGKIYIIENPYNNKVYIGSTNNFKKRINNHNYNFKNDNTKNLYTNLKDVNINDIQYNILEEVIYNNKIELLRREGEFIKEYRENNNYNVINKKIPGRTHREHYIDNKQAISDKYKIYYLNHKEQINNRNLNNYYKNKVK